MKIVLCIFLLSLGLSCSENVKEKKTLSSWETDYDYDDYEPFKHFDPKLSDILDTINESEGDKKVQDNDETLIGNAESIDYYQFEDNRDKGKSDNLEAGFEVEDDKNNNDYDMLWSDTDVAPDSKENVEHEIPSEIVELSKKILEDDTKSDKEIEINDYEEDHRAYNEQIMVETKKILEEDADTFERNLNNDLDNNSEFEFNPRNQEIAEETTKILKEIDDNFDEYESEKQTKEPKDLNYDLDKLFETLDKLTDKDDKIDDDNYSYYDTDSESSENKNESAGLDGIEGIFDYDNNLDNTQPLEDDALEKTNPLDEQNQNDTQTIVSETIQYVNDAIDDKQTTTTTPRVTQTTTRVTQTTPRVTQTTPRVTQEATQTTEETIITVKQVDVDELSSKELDGLTKMFAELHKDVIDLTSDSFVRDVPAIHVTLSLDEPTVITSPNYPGPYPTNNIVDWVVEGDGMGIEMNVTDLAVNGALGDYVLVKPGGVEDDGHDRIIFTYRINSERKFRFLDVNKMFIRFQANPGMMFFNGFSMSVKLIAPDSTSLQEPEPLEVVEEVHPNITVTFTLALNVFRFNETRDDFTKLLEDMAALYVKENKGFEDVTKHDVVITSVLTCPINWPDFEQCSAVKFGIALERANGPQWMEEMDILDMWYSYKKLEEFAVRMEEMGLRPFSPPASPLTAWLVLAAAVLVSMAVLAFVLWRYSCFQTYTRMPTFTDSESLQDEKRGLDLYPTPHQTLPPLFTDTEYKWVSLDHSRVDRGGLANKSYVKDTMYDFESDEEVQNIDKKTSIDPRNIYSVA